MPDIIEMEYWDVRFILPKLMMDGVTEVTDYLIEKYKIKGDTSHRSRFSFYFHLKDELLKVAKMEREGEGRIVPHRKPKKKSGIKPSPRRNHFPELLELDILSQGDVLRAQEIKRLPYSIVYEQLLVESIKQEDEYL